MLIFSYFSALISVIALLPPVYHSRHCKNNKTMAQIEEKLCIIFTQSYLIPLNSRFKGFLISDY